MPDAPTAYPLAWPPGWPRRPEYNRADAKFGAMEKQAGGGFSYARKLTVAEALKRLAEELDRIAAKYIVISSNLKLGAKGAPLSDQRKPSDPGVCVYFQLKGKPTTLPCDRYRTVEGNLAAIAAHIEATRAIQRHGVGTLDQMFTGFQALRAPGPKPWREVLGIKPEQPVDRVLLRQRRAELARTHHSDLGGSDDRMAEINAAYDRALLEIVA